MSDHNGLFTVVQEEGGAKAEVDYIFEIPVELARTLTGYRHDARIRGAGDKTFEVLAETSSISSAGGNKRSILKKLFDG